MNGKLSVCAPEASFQKDLDVAEVVSECRLSSKQDLEPAFFEIGFVHGKWRELRALRCWLRNQEPVEFDCVGHGAGSLLTSNAAAEPLVGRQSLQPSFASIAQLEILSFAS